MKPAYIPVPRCIHGLERRDGVCLACSHPMTRVVRGRRRGLYRYRVANPGYGAGLNRVGAHVMGLYVKVGGFSYCVKWS